MIVCSLCSNLFARDALEEHIRRELCYAAFRCAPCRLSFFTLRDGQRHLTKRQGPHGSGAAPGNLVEEPHEETEQRLEEALVASCDAGLPPPASCPLPAHFLPNSTSEAVEGKELKGSVAVVRGQDNESASPILHCSETLSQRNGDEVGNPPFDLLSDSEEEKQEPFALLEDERSDEAEKTQKSCTIMTVDSTFVPEDEQPQTAATPAVDDCSQLLTGGNESLVNHALRREAGEGGSEDRALETALLSDSEAMLVRRPSESPPPDLLVEESDRSDDASALLHSDGQLIRQSLRSYATIEASNDKQVEPKKTADIVTPFSGSNGSLLAEESSGAQGKGTEAWSDENTLHVSFVTNSRDDLSAANAAGYGTQASESLLSAAMLIEDEELEEPFEEDRLSPPAQVVIAESLASEVSEQEEDGVLEEGLDPASPRPAKALGSRERSGVELLRGLWHHCRICDEDFERMDAHVKKRHLNGVRPFECLRCEERLTTLQLLRRHQVKEHDLQATEETFRVIGDGEDAVKTQTLACFGGQKRQRTVKALPKVTCSDCQQQVSTDKMMRHVAERHMDEATLVCLLCGHGEGSRQRMVKHARAAHNVAEKDFRIGGHYASQSRKQKGTAAALCGKFFGVDTAAASWWRRPLPLAAGNTGEGLQHLEEAPKQIPKVPCRLCRREYTTRSLESHINVHLPEDVRNRLHCLICSFRSGAKGSFRNHLRRIHGQAKLTAENARVVDTKIEIADKLTECFGPPHDRKEQRSSERCTSCHALVRREKKSHHTAEHLGKTFYACKLCLFKSRSPSGFPTSKHTMEVHGLRMSEDTVILPSQALKEESKRLKKRLFS